ncbi:MAG: DUF4384 domain-containing protein [candidate division WOR-3 bacterium]|nr:DUF4384 domain-containing protein [candidate division WOR-3 bacterium]
MMVVILPLFILFNMQTDTTNSLNVDIWLDRDDLTFSPGDRLKIFFRANTDCYVAVYNIDAGGRENLLFPLQGDKGYVQKDRVYELPPPDADYDYEISGPEGTEKIIILAAEERLPTLADTHYIKKELELKIEEPEPAKLRIISIPPRCKIYITDAVSRVKKYIGRTPRTIVLRPGEYIVEIKKFGYKTIKRRIRLEPDEKRRVYVHLLPW